jgi:hypothetical protein
MSASVSALRQLLANRFPDAAPLAERDARRIAAPVATNLAALDQAFPGGGLPRGKLTAWLPQGGATAVLRAACHAAIAAGERAAWIDAAHTAGPGWQEGPLLIRPVAGVERSGTARQRRAVSAPPRRDDPLRRLNALRSTEVVLRSGGFALVVLAGAAPEGTETVRLVRAAREGGSALVVLTSGASLASLRVTSRLLPHGYRWAPGPFADPAAPLTATVQVRVRTLGWNRQAELVLPVTPYELRLSLDPGLADRRGGER